MHTLSNDQIEIKIAAKGAELQSIYNRTTGLEYMWQAGPEWPKSSPVLFPIVGGLKNNTYEHNGQHYNLSRHGFARDMVFDLISQDGNSMTFLLKHSAETLAKYPFEFSFYLKYTLHENKVQLTYIVNNPGQENMYFSVGAHPAFAVPLVPGTAYDDYYLEFRKPETAPRWPLSNEGLIETISEKYLEGASVIPLTKELFAKDAIVLKDLESKEVYLKSDKTPHGLTVRYDGFPYMGLWAAGGANFVCIEPWCGIADSVNASGNLEDKEGIHTIAKGESFERSFTIEVY